VGPEVVKTAEEVRERVAQARAAGKSVGLVPTMGALHEGHLSLMRRARADCEYVAVSIFVNPTQFVAGEDLARYPRDLAADARQAGEVGVDLAFAPEVEEIYPPGDSTFVEVTGTLVEGMCAPHRPWHFRGVTTICARLFNIFMADRAYFGEKDYQQLRIIKQMARDLKMPLEIVSVPTLREPDGLAMSSRNAFLSPGERTAATVIHRALTEAKRQFERGERSAAALVASATAAIADEPMAGAQYVELRDAETLALIERVDAPAVLAAAVFVGKTRLIDNVVLREDASA
jgi:pantoate--beta-alanine ligase